MLLNAPKYQSYNFFCFWVIKGKPTGGWSGGGVKLLAPIPGKVNNKLVENFEDQRNKFLKQTSLAYSCMIYQSLWYRAAES